MGDSAGFDAGFDKGHDAGFNKGFDAGYNEGYAAGQDPMQQGGVGAGRRTLFDAGYVSGHKAGYMEGIGESGSAAAEQIVASLLGDSKILPQYTVEDLIRRALDGVIGEAVPLLKPEAVAVRLKEALAKRRPMSLIRLGDGEALVLAQETVLDAQRVSERGPWLSRAGVVVPDLQARDQLNEAIRTADIVGVPIPRLPNHQPLLTAAFQSLGITWGSLTLTQSVINYALHVDGLLQEIAAGRVVLLVGNRAEELAAKVREAGVRVAGAIQPIRGMADIERALALVEEHTFDLALVAAGVPAVVMCPAIAKRHGKVAIDLGHLADDIADGMVPWETRGQKEKADGDAPPA